MPAETKLYSRGQYRLERDIRRDGTPRSPFYQIVWYDQRARRNRSRSTRTTSIEKAEDALDRLYSEKERGVTICPCCQRPLESSETYSIELAITDYLIAKADECSSIVEMRSRLGHFLDFLSVEKLVGLGCDDIRPEMIGRFRRWSRDQPVFVGHPEKGRTRPRSPSTTEATVRQLKAVVNHAFAREQVRSPARFSPLRPEAVDRTPSYRASVHELADMFRYCIAPQPPRGRIWSKRERERTKESRLPLLRFLQISIATWCRPDAAHDFSTLHQRNQWISDAQINHLNPRGRVQTRKRRPSIPVPKQIIGLIERTEGLFVPVASVRKAFEAMTKEIGIRKERETGMKLIRRSIAQLVRDRIGEHRWIQGRIMLGHEKSTTSDLYALRKREHLGLALRHTEAIIDEIESAVPGAFTGSLPEITATTGAISA